ncbi:TPA: DUF4355 domain-containing protein [Enterococcus faecium]
MKKRLFMPMTMNLQFFSEPGDGGSGNEGQQVNPPAGSQETPPTGKGENTIGKTFSRDEVAKMIAAETRKAVSAAEEKWRAEKTEADKLAEMDEKEKADYEKQKLEERIAQYERQENLSKMSEQASEMLIEKGAQPTKEMLNLIVSEDADTTSANVKTYLAAIEAERETIKAEYEKKLGGRIPLDGVGVAPAAGEYGKQLAQRTQTGNAKSTYFKN